MSDRRMRLGLVVNGSRPAAAEVALALNRAASGRHIETVHLHLPPAGGSDAGAGSDAGTDAGNHVDVVVGIGGDGTLLEAAQIAHRADLPVAGINLGTVGYLTEFEPDDLGALLDAVTGHPRRETARMTVRASIASRSEPLDDGGASPGSEWHGINDVVLEKVLSQRIVRIAVAIDGEYFTTYRADGIIVATPLGSTAYSLSVGGPVLDPELEALVVSPVAPHSLLSRSLVVSPDTVMEFTVAGDRPVRVNLDGREACELADGDTLTVARGSRPVRFVTRGASPFPQAVRRQFGLDHA